MSKYIFKRIILALLTMVIALTITFFLLRLVNKEPSAIEEEISRRIMNNPHSSPITIKNNIYITYDYHPNWNAFKAFGHYLSKLIHGNFGIYYANKSLDKSIPEQFAEPLKYTFLVSGIGFLLGTTIGLAFGIFAGYKRGKLSDVALNIISILFVAIPSFVLAALFVLLANKSDWPIRFLPANLAGSTLAMFKTLIIPIGIITLTSFATITYYVRNEIVEILKSDYIATARSKGLSETKIFFKHVARNISIPAVTIILPNFIFIIMGSLVIEMFFGVPGTASMFSTAITKYEYNVVMFSILFFTSLSIVINIVIDVLYTILDPRIRLAEKKENTLFERMKKRKQRKVALND